MRSQCEVPDSGAIPLQTYGTKASAVTKPSDPKTIPANSTTRRLVWGHKFHAKTSDPSKDSTGSAQALEAPSEDEVLPPLKPSYVDARVIARRYSVTPRYILQLATEGKIPSLRLGVKAVRFCEADVAKALEGGVEQ